MTLDATVADQPLRGATAVQAYRRFWQRIVVFSGRASLSEYWWPVLLNTLVLIAGAIVVGVLLAVGGSVGSPLDAVTNALAGVIVVALVLLLLAMTLASVAVGVRRLHDADLSGLFLLLGLLPSVGGIIVLVLSLLPSNPRGVRFDLAGASAGPVRLAADPVPAFDPWPAAEPIGTATAPVPAGARLDDAAAGVAPADVWSGVGALSPLDPPLSAPPGTRDQGYLRIERTGRPALLATDGLHAGEGVAALGPGAELFTGAPEEGDPAASWRLALLAAVARRVRASGLHLPAELAQYGTLSMSIGGVPAPDAWRTDGGAVGVLLGLPVDGVPATAPTAGGEVALVSVTPLRPAELQEILDGGATARGRVAGRLAALPETARADRL